MDWSAIADPRHAISNAYLGNGWSRYRSDSGDMLDYAGFERFRLTGGAGNDTLAGGGEDDTLRGGGGDDWLSMGEGGGTAEGGEGNDRLVANLSARGAATFGALDSQTTSQLGSIGLNVTTIEAVTLTTGSRADNLSTAGFALSDQFYTGDGNDTVNPGLGQDTVDGAGGTDLLVLDWGTATSNIANVYLGNGWSRYFMADGSSAVDYAGIERFQLTGGLGHDALTGGGLNDTLNGDAGRDVIQGGGGTDLWRGNAGAATDGLSLAMSAAGNGTLTGIGTTLKSIESVVLTTGTGNDTINLGALSGNDTLSTGNGDDVIDIGRGLSETVDAGNGVDVLTADFGLALTSVRMFYTGNGWTAAEAIGGDYRLDFGGVERLNLTGSSRNDRMYGFDGNDTLNGAAGSDQLNGGNGDDVLTGGAGPDTFIFTSLWNAGQDRITDAGAGDYLRFTGLSLTGSVVAGAGAGLMEGQVAVQIGATSAVMRIGLDALAGADLVVTLDGAFSLSNFLASGNDLLIV